MLLPADAADAAARTKELEAELAAVDGDLADADAQHRLYTLLGERTRYGPRIPRRLRPSVVYPKQASHRWLYLLALAVPAMHGKSFYETHTGIGCMQVRFQCMTA